MGTAQALGSSKAVMEMVSAQSARSSRSPYGTGTANEIELVEEAPNVLRRICPHRSRHSSSSSSSAGGAGFEIPSSVLHPASALHASR